MTESTSSQRTEIDAAEYDRIAAEIYSESSPVGIDAQKTHVLILHKLDEILRRLDVLEQGERNRQQEA